MGKLPPFVVRTGEVPEVESSYPPPHDEEKLSLGRNVGAASGSRTLGVWRERLPPGRRTSFTHAHSREEEVVYVLAGRPSVRWIAPGRSAEECELQPGDCATFVAGTGIAHTIANRTDEDAELLVFGERRPGDRVVYPEDASYAAWMLVHRPHRAWADAHGPGTGARAPAIRIETERLVLRAWDEADTSDLLAAIDRNRAHLLPFIPWAHEQLGLDALAARIADWRRDIANGDTVYGAFEPDGTIVGGTGFHHRIGPHGREIGYWVDHEREGRGYVTEWCAGLVRVAFEVLLVDRLEIHCQPENVRSWKVAERLGFQREVTLPRRILASNGTLRDAMIWTMYADSYPQSTSSLAKVRAWDGLGRRLL